MFDYIFDLLNVKFDTSTEDLIIRISYFAFLVGVMLGVIVVGYAAKN